MCEQSHCWVAVVLVSRDLVGIRGWVGRTRVATATAATEYPGKGSNYGSVQAVAGTFADKAVESRVGHTVQGGQQQRQVVVVKYF